MDFVEEFGSNVNKYSSLGEHMNIFVHQRLRSSFDLYQVSHILTITNYQVTFDILTQVSDSGPHGPLVSICIKFL